MNQNPSDNSPNVPESGRAVVAGKADPHQNDRSDRFDPLLQHALNSLDIKLEDELNRFRSKQADPTSDVAVASPVEVVWEQQSADFDDADILTAEIVRSAIAYPEPEPQSSQGFIVIDSLSTQRSRQGADAGYAEISLQPERSADRDNLDLNFSSGGEIAPLHDEYLSSSQELLRQIQSGYTTNHSAENRNRSQPTTPKPKRKISPLKIGSMAAACVIAGGAAYTYFNPSILAPLATTKTSVPTLATTTSSLGQSIQSPNLAANEFTDLNLSAVNTIKVPAASAPAPTNNISNAPTATFAPPASAATVPAAVPFKSGAPILSPTATITAQPRLADSLVRSLLPPNFQAVNERSIARPLQPQLKR
jgi:hypothetical protein